MSFRSRALPPVLAAFVVLALASMATAAGPAIKLTAPASGAVLDQTIVLRASAPHATGVAFRAWYADADAVRRWHRLAVDVRPADGFSMTWTPTAAILRQERVLVGAVLLDIRGRGHRVSRSVLLGSTAAGDADRVSSGSPVEATPTGAGPYGVTGTCRSAECKLRVRGGPGASFAQVRQLADGQEVRVRCQTAGETVLAGPNSSAVWDHLTDGGWVSDLYLTTPGQGRFSETIPRCP